MLGYRSGQFTEKSHFGRVSDDFGMDEVRCVGNEASIFDCDFEIGHDCFGGEGLGVICSGIFEDPEKKGVTLLGVQHILNTRCSERDM